MNISNGTGVRPRLQHHFWSRWDLLESLPLLWYNPLCMAVHIHDKLALLTFGDDMALEEVMAVTSLRACVVKVIPPRAVVVERQELDALVQELRKRGYTPKVVG